MTVDLDALRRTEPEPATRSGTAGRIVVVVLVVGVLGWAFLLARQWLFPARKVTAVPIRVEAGGASSGGAVEATGWLEPDPFPVVVRPLVDGVVESVEVLEGHAVEAGKTVIGRLASAERRAALDRAEAVLARARRAHEEAQANLAVAEGLLEQKLDLRRDAARFDGEAALARAELATATAEAEAADRATDAARVDLEAQEALARRGSAAPVTLARAKAAHAAAQAAASAKRAAVDRAESALERATAEQAIAREGLASPRGLEGEVAKGKARLLSAAAELHEATVGRDVAAREVEWLTVLAPVDGVVLRREAAPGTLVGPGVMPLGGAESAPDMAVGGLVSLYDPKHLQARIDVPLAFVAGVGAGRKAEITVEALPGRTFHGVVTRIEGRADPLKNTLQVKVRIDDPDPVMKPEMLARARFLAAPSAAAPTAGEAAGPARILVPKQALKGDVVFVLDPRGGGRARAVRVVKVAEEGEWVEVKGDLSATHRAILDAVEDGERVEGGGS
jgi:multidrug efflux pump subunit AcrA (membrane-fusion protein)